MTARPGPTGPCHRLRGDRGAATVELAVATPLLLLLLLFVVQAGVWAHAAHIARAAAVQALDAAAAENSTAAAGQREGAAALRQLGGAVLTGARVTVTRTATRVTVTVSGTAATVVPGIRPPVSVTVTGPVEMFVPMSYEFTNSEAVSGGNRSGGGR